MYSFCIVAGEKNDVKTEVNAHDCYSAKHVTMNEVNSNKIGASSQNFYEKEIAWKE